jgi:DHA3 family macrolide efflux protein-like MFS transporter
MSVERADCRAQPETPLKSKDRAMLTFIVIWLGQLVSLTGSGLSGFALGLWVYQRTGSVTQFALISLFVMLPTILLSPLAGALVDRWDRRWVMILSDAGAGFSTLMVASLLISGRLEVWHIYLAAAVSSAFGAFQSPAYLAVIGLLVPKQHLGRTGGMVQIGQAASDILAPALAGLLVLTIQIWGVILIDFATFAFAVFTLLWVRVPRPEIVADETITNNSLLREVAQGWTYIVARRGLLGLLVYLAVVNSFLGGMVGPLITPMVLSFASTSVLGMVISVAGSGMLIGSLVMSAWGGPKRRIASVLGFELMAGLFILLIGLRPSALLVAAGAFGAHFAIPLVRGANLAIWQSKVTPHLQGRVFAAQRMIVSSATPLASLAAGPLADGVFDPLLAEGGPLATSVGAVVGVGAGRGIGLLFIALGILTALTTCVAFLSPCIRLVEDELADRVYSRGSLTGT